MSTPAEPVRDDSVQVSLGRLREIEEERVAEEHAEQQRREQEQRRDDEQPADRCRDQSVGVAKLGRAGAARTTSPRPAGASRGWRRWSQGPSGPVSSG
mgnify:CR=1 FL=1